MRGRILRRQSIPRPPAEVGAFFEDPRNLQRITPPWLGFRITAAPSTTIARGSRIDYRLRLWGIPVRWHTLIARSDPGWGFVDTQERGPYRSWIHTHTFTPTVTGVMMEDRVDYELPFGLLGAAAAPFVAVQLRAIFAYRREMVTRIFVPSPQPGVTPSAVSIPLPSETRLGVP